MLKIKDKEDILKATRREKKDSKRNKESQLTFQQKQCKPADNGVAPLKS